MLFRSIAVDENGNIIDGDSILYILASRLKARGMLDKSTVVATIMSNTGLIKALEKENIKCVRTAVGDRFVYECMQKNGYKLGGEQSGHIILQKYATTGDGLLTAIMILEQMCDAKSTLSNLCKAVVALPQYEQNVRVKNKETAISHPQVQAKLQEITQEIGDTGRVLLRKSGTEPVIRIMVEHESLEQCKAYAGELVQIIRQNKLCEE